MTLRVPEADSGCRELSSASGLAATFTEHGCLSRLEIDGLSLLRYPATAHEAGPANIHLRILEADLATWIPLLGPSSPSRISWEEAGPVVTGHWLGLDYRLAFRFGASDAAWFWHLTVRNAGSREITVDTVLTHDPGLAPYGAVRANEFYVSQYLDLTPLATERGTAIAVRQNMPGERYPWMLLGSLRTGAGWATDSLQLVRGAPRPGCSAALSSAVLPSRRLQHEHALVTLADEPVSLEPGSSMHGGFFGSYLPHHPAATSKDDAAHAARVAARPEAEPPSEDRVDVAGGSPVVGGLFAVSPAFAAEDLDPDSLAELAGHADIEVAETGPDGQVWSWFGQDRSHLVAPAKERQVLRPHGHLLRTGDALVPDTDTLTSTVWMDGTFHSQVTRGHVGHNRVLSTRRGYLGEQRAHGLRVFIEDPDSPNGWALLETPSGWAQWPDRCRWWYCSGDTAVEVSSSALVASHALDFQVRWISGAPRRLRIAMHLSLSGDDGLAPARHRVVARSDGVTVVGEEHSLHLCWAEGTTPTVRPDGPLFADGLDRGTGWITLDVEPVTTFGMRFRVAAQGRPPVDQPREDQRLGEAFTTLVDDALELSAPGPARDSVAELDRIIPWFAQNALVHYLTPRGLEQFSGGAWGTRDVCQGPVGLLTALGRFEEVRDVLLRVLRGQNERGDWPQAFDFLPPLPSAGQQDAHGDVLYWPLLAVGDYLRSTQDRTFLTERVDFVGDTARTDPAPVVEHLRRALDRIDEVTVPGTPLPAYGHGDWNDSLQPADPTFAARMVSTWTTVLLVTALRSLADGLDAVDGPEDLIAWSRSRADESHRALLEDLMADRVLPGYVLMHDEGPAEPLLHPRDTRTGLHYSLLPWVHAVSADLLSPGDAARHLELVGEHLLGPDGARLFDRPVTYRGGPMTVFQRAEGSTFWGREIGLMYVHAHLRYAEALARFGDATGLFEALCRVNPIGITNRVPGARPRQSTTYFSSSDAVFLDRQDAEARYADLMAGQVDLEGGWRVYSSGPGLFLRLVVESLLGIRVRGDSVEVDPVLAPGLDGLNAVVPLGDKRLRVTYRLGAEGVGASSVSSSDGVPLATSPLANPYRSAGVRVDRAEVSALGSGTTIDLIVETH